MSFSLSDPRQVLLKAMQTGRVFIVERSRVLFGERRITARHVNRILTLTPAHDLAVALDTPQEYASMRTTVKET